MLGKMYFDFQFPTCFFIYFSEPLIQSVPEWLLTLRLSKSMDR